MFFYIDESGHTGTNLFDDSQPRLYYGVLSTKTNLDVLGESLFPKLRGQLGVQRLHAAQLGNGRLNSIVKDIVAIQRDFDITFDLYSVVKTDHAVISFFDQVFDQGMNPAVPWTAYWTPLRYILLLKLAWLFDEDLLKKVWEARIDFNSKRADAILKTVCREIRHRAGYLPDARSIQIISDALSWAETNPHEIRYNAKSKNELLQITPNIIGFQSVMHGIAMRLKSHGLEASKIVVDQQIQFNKAQRTLSEFFQRFSKVKNIPSSLGPGLPELDFSGIPDIPISFESSANVPGLELVDIYLWIFKRFMEGKDLAPELYSIIDLQRERGFTDEISLNGIEKRWSKFFEELPEPTKEEKAKARELMEIHEKRRLRALGGEPNA